MGSVASDQLLAVLPSDSPIVGLATAMELKRLSCQSRLTQDRNEFIRALKHQRLDIVVICKAVNRRYGNPDCGWLVMMQHFAPFSSLGTFKPEGYGRR